MCVHGITRIRIAPNVEARRTQPQTATWKDDGEKYDYKISKKACRD